MTQKTWKTKKGASICSLSSSAKAGIGTATSLGPQTALAALKLAADCQPLHAKYLPWGGGGDHDVMGRQRRQ